MTHRVNLSRQTCRNPSANAGTHNHKCPLLRSLWLQLLSKLKSVVMGPRMRGDDERVWLHPGHHHVFDLDIFLHAVMRAFAPQAGLLDAAEGRDFGGNEPGVDADHA
ncbi:hypothetical protein V1277_003175 [Bradyrhizobium sp. AZCC 1588]